MALRRPTTGLSLPARVAARLHPRRLRRRLPLALATAAVVAAAPTLGLGAGSGGGDGRAVLVAVSDLAPGHVVGEGDLRLQPVPAELAPPGAVRAVPAGTVVRSAISRGEVVVAHRLGGGAGVPDRLTAGQRAVAVPWPLARPPLAVGDAVDLVGTTAMDQSGAVTTRLLAAQATVLAVAEDGVTVAVPAAVAPSVHETLATGVVDLAVSPLRP